MRSLRVRSRLSVASISALAIAVVLSLLTPLDAVRGAESGDESRARCSQSISDVDDFEAVAESAAPGSVVCIGAGTYDSTGTVTISASGTAAQPIRVQAERLHEAIFTFRLVITGSYVQVSGLSFRETSVGADKPPSPQILGDHVSIVHSDISNDNTGICAGVGSADIAPTGWRFENNFVHDCGRQPSTNHDHGLYVAKARGGVVASNLFVRNADRAAQLYPDADNVSIVGNVMLGNGEGIIFGGDGKSSSDNNRATKNVIANSTLRANIESNWGGPVGVGNVATNNCLWLDGDLGVTTEGGGFSATANRLVLPPKYAGGPSLTLSSDNPCRS